MPRRPDSGSLSRSDSGASFRSQPHNRAKGAAAERRGIAWLRRRGYRVLALNVTNCGGEIDVVAADGDTLCFIEIKARATDRFGPAVLAVDATKRRKLVRAATAHLAAHPWEGPCRFDVLGMDLVDGAFEYTLLRDAFSSE
jgi:putative endonuclease